MLAPKLVEAHIDDGADRSPNPPAGAYRARDGWIAVTLVREAQFAALCRALGRPELAADPRFDTGAKRVGQADRLRSIVAAAIAGRTVAEWLDVLGEAEVLCNPVNAPVDWLADEHVLATDAAPRLEQSGVGPVPVPRIPGLPDGALANLASGAPAIGEHGAEILSEFGYDTAAIAALRECGALGGPPPPEA